MYVHMNSRRNIEKFWLGNKPKKVGYFLLSLGGPGTVFSSYVDKNQKLFLISTKILIVGLILLSLDKILRKLWIRRHEGR